MTTLMTLGSVSGLGAGTVPVGSEAGKGNR
jgi:hypothetical protein